MIRNLAELLLPLFLSVAIVASAQQGPGTPKGSEDVPQAPEPTANPGRPTVSTPAILTPVGYLQFENGFLGAWHSPEFSSQLGINQ